jgi:hypothetical protein
VAKHNATWHVLPEKPGGRIGGAGVKVIVITRERRHAACRAMTFPSGQQPQAVITARH